MKTIKKEFGQWVEFESTGKQIYANNHIIGIDPELEVSQGYDGGFSEGWGSDILNNEEVNELADYMIDLWGKYRKANTHKIICHITLDDSRVKKQMRKVKRTIFLLRVKMYFKVFWKGFLLAIERGLIRK